MRRALLWGASGRRSRRRRDDEGAAALEFALILPILVMLVFGIIAFGYMLSFRQAMSQAAAEGGRAAAVKPAGTPNDERYAAARAAVNDALSAYGVACTAGGGLTHSGGPSGTCTIVIGACSSGPAGAECAKVTLHYPYSDNSLIPGLGINAILPDDLEYSTEVRVS
ncbi:TadE family protein [Nocardioides stalactiti]|uniref:TadE family protein n=1 Tax=Nocardioides stalactiti TaxID=2755356 RepID=UPI00160365FB|nr:TadE/TadG family type IV pilus assembly protein [Nocardioides stalactiti]